MDIKHLTKLSQITKKKWFKPVILIIGSVMILVIIFVIALSMRISEFESSLLKRYYIKSGNEFIHKYEEKTNNGNTNHLYTYTYNKNTKILKINRSSLTIINSAGGWATVYDYIIDIKSGEYLATYEFLKINYYSNPGIETTSNLEFNGNFYKNSSIIVKNDSLRNFIHLSNKHVKSILDETWIPNFLYGI